MPRLNERTHRLICRTGLIALCALPTLWVAGWIVVQKLPSHRSAWETALAARLDADVRLKAVRHPQPGLTRLEGVMLVDAARQQPILEAARVDLRQQGGTWIAQCDRAVLHHNPRLLRRLLARCAAPCVGRADCPVEISIEQLVLDDDADHHALRHFAARRDGGGELYVSAQLQVDAEAPWRLQCSTLADGARRVRLDTGPAPLPATIAAWLWPAVQTLGEQATFVGKADILATEYGLTGQAAGSLQRLNLLTLTERFLPTQPRVSGEAGVKLADVRFQNGRLVQFQGSFSSRSGKIGQPWLEALVHEFSVQWKTAVDGHAGSSTVAIPYDELAFEFVLQPHQLRIAGACAGAPPETMMTGRDGRVVLSTALSQPQPVTSLARLLSPPTRDWIPATVEAHWVLQFLPLTEQNTASRSRDGLK